MSNAMKRIKTKYPGIYYREVQRIGGKGTERMFYITFKKQGKFFEEKAGRQYSDGMSAAKAARVRAERIEGKRQSRKELRTEAKTLKELENRKMTIDRLWQLYKDSQSNHNPQSFNIDEGRYKKYLLPLFADKESSEILLLDVDRLRLKLLKEKSPQTTRHVLALLKRIIRFGEKRNLCQSLSFPIQMPRVNNIVTEDLSPTQLTNLLKAIDEDENFIVGCLMKVALFTGMRKGELFKLTWPDIDLDRSFITIRGPKGGVDQKIPLNEGVRRVLESLPRSEESPYVFPGRGGKQRATVQKAANRIKAKAGLPKDFRPLHGLRHVFASMLASSGEVDMYTLQRLLTHKSPIMTMRYAHLRDETLKKASGVANSIVIAAMGKISQEAIGEK